MDKENLIFTNNNMTTLAREEKIHIELILANTLIESAYTKFVPTGRTYEDALRNALDKVFLMDLPDRCTGKVLCNLSIAIKSFRIREDEEGEINLPHSDIKRKICELCAQAIVFMHEFWHFIQREGENTLGAVLQYSTPKQLLDTYSESGFKVETEIFGCILKYITYEAAEFLLEHNYPETLDLFQQQFSSLNNKSSSSAIIKLSRFIKSSGNYIKLGHCGYVPKVSKFNAEEESKHKSN